jgi:DNA-directed RNA polymerase sigma subunit (sigma70/sigma32)
MVIAMTRFSVPASKRFIERNPGMDWLDDSELELVGEQEQLILRLRCGIDDGKKRTLREVADHFGFKSENRIRVLQNRALYEISQQRQRDQST